MSIGQIVALEQAPKILLTGTITPDVQRKLEAEARSVGLTLVEEQGARPGEGFVGTLRVEGHAIEVVVEHGQERSARTFVDDPGLSEPLAVRVVEELRARLVELDVLPASNAGAPAPASQPPHQMTPMVPNPAPDSAPQRGVLGPRLLWAETGMAFTTASGSLGATLQAAVGLRFEPSEAWNVGALALLPLTENNVSAPQGSADVLVNVFAARLQYRLAEPHARLYGHLGAGGGVAVLAMNSEASAPFRAHTERLYTGTYFGCGSIGYRLTEWLSVRGDLMLGVSAPRAVVRFDGREVAAWGHTVGSGVLGLEFGVFESGATR